MDKKGKIDLDALHRWNRTFNYKSKVPLSLRTKIYKCPVCGERHFNDKSPFCCDECRQTRINNNK